jgi:hypothetical protein
VPQLFGALRSECGVAQAVGEEDDGRAPRDADERGAHLGGDVFHERQQVFVRLGDGKRPQISAAGSGDGENRRRLGGDLDIAKARGVTEVGVARDAAVVTFLHGEDTDPTRHGAHADDETVDHVVARGRRFHRREDTANVGKRGGGALR